MKNKSIYIIALAVLFASCSKYLDVNNTPNNPLAVPPSTLLPNTTVGIAFANSNELGRALSLVMQYNAGTANQALQEDIYNLDNQLDNQWNGEIYGNTLNDLQILIDQYQTTSPVYSGIAKLEKAYIISVATDLWGDVPYSQAAQGLKFPSPRFDKQQDIYMGTTDITGLFDLVKSGLADLDKTGALAPGVDDLVYKGDLSKWKRMANTLLLKFALQISAKNPTLATSTISGVLTGNNYINANNLDFEVPFGTTTGNQSPIYSFNNVNRTTDLTLSTRFFNLLKGMNDTIRLSKFFTRPTGVFVTYDNGAVVTAPAAATRSKYNVYLTGVSGEAPVRLLTNFQVQFILAEAALTLGTAGDPDVYFKAGITANMQKIGMTASEITTYFAANPTIVTLTGTNAQKLQQIIMQKYIAWVGNAVESYNDYRRTGYPVLALAQNAAGDNPNLIPVRLPYTPNELARNPNAPNPRPKMDVKVWWQN